MKFSTIYATDESISWQFLTNLRILLMSREEASVFSSIVMVVLALSFASIPWLTLTMIDNLTCLQGYGLLLEY